MATVPEGIKSVLHCDDEVAKLGASHILLAGCAPTGAYGPQPTALWSTATTLPSFKTSTSLLTYTNFLARSNRARPH